MSDERRLLLASAAALVLGFFVWLGLRWMAAQVTSWLRPPTPTPTSCQSGQGCRFAFLIVDRIAATQVPLAYSIWLIETRPAVSPQRLRVTFNYLDGAPQGVRVPLPPQGWRADPAWAPRLRQAFVQHYDVPVDGYIMVDFDMWIDMLNTLLARQGAAPARTHVVEALFAPQVPQDEYPKRWGPFLIQSCEALYPHDAAIVWSYWLGQQGVHILTDITVPQVQAWQRAFHVTEETRHACTFTTR